MDIEKEILDIKKMIADLNTTLLKALQVQQKAFNRLFERQLEELKAVRTAFRLNVERDEDLMDALGESNDPWVGC